MGQSNTIINKDITTTKVEKKKIELDIKATKKQYNESFQRFTNNEKETRQLQSQIQELTTMTSGVIKMTNELTSELAKLDHSLTNYKED